MYTIHLKLVDGQRKQHNGKNYSYTSGIHYLDDVSYPDCIVVKVEKDGE